MSYKTILFDLDGTLLDTLRDLYSSINRALKANSLPERSLDEVRRFVGNGIRKLVERAVPAETAQEMIEQVLLDFKTDYAEHSNDETAPYPGVMDALSALRLENKTIAIVSNKADFAVQHLSALYFGDLIDFPLGEREGIPRKPAPDMIRFVLDSLSADPTTAVYVGDSDVDVETARNADMDLVLVDWGFRDRETLLPLLEDYPKHRRATIVSTVDDLLRALSV